MKTGCLFLSSPSNSDPSSIHISSLVRKPAHTIKSYLRKLLIGSNEEKPPVPSKGVYGSRSIRTFPLYNKIINQNCDFALLKLCQWSCCCWRDENGEGCWHLCLPTCSCLQRVPSWEFVCRFPFVLDPLWASEGTLWERAYSVLRSLSLFQGSPGDLSNFVTSEYYCYFLPVTVSILPNRLLFFYFYLFLFLSPYWWKGIY